jgi:ElaB/YqjD/DUF883 family membrane-anchored ribosome-binding protein
MSHVEQLERETEQTRLQIAHTLDELKESVTPAHVLHQLADRMGDGAPAEFARNLKDHAVKNPLPIAFISAGLAWLMLNPQAKGGFMRRSSERADGASDAAQQFAAQTTDTARETADSIANSTGQTAAETADTLRGAAGSMSESVRSTASSGYETMADTARRTTDSISESARNVGQRTLQSGDAFVNFCREQPMVVAGIGLAIGAIVGALFPTSQTEDRLLGEASDRAKESAQSFAAEKYEGAKNVGERAFEAAKDEAARQTNAQGQTGRSEEEHEGHPTLVPSDGSELERRGQPWTDDNSPV